MLIVLSVPYNASSSKLSLWACYVVLWHPPVIGDFFSVGFKMLAWTNRKFAHLSKSLIGHTLGGVVCRVYVLLHDLNFYGTTFSLPSRRCWRVFFMDHNWIIAGGLCRKRATIFWLDYRVEIDWKIHSLESVSSWLLTNVHNWWYILFCSVCTYYWLG